MTVKSIRESLAAIEAVKRDPEDAHGKQDDLLYDVLVAIADGKGRAASLAREALKVCDIEFPRWMA